MSPLLAVLVLATFALPAVWRFIWGSIPVTTAGTFASTANALLEGTATVAGTFSGAGAQGTARIDIAGSRVSCTVDTFSWGARLTG